MKESNFPTLLMALIALAGLFSLERASAQTVLYQGYIAQNYTRACRYPFAPTQVTTSGTSQQTAALKGETVYRVLCASDTYVSQGSNPTAASTSMRVVANSELYVLMKGSDKLALLQVSTSGVCEVTECQ